MNALDRVRQQLLEAKDPPRSPLRGAVEPKPKWLPSAPEKRTIGFVRRQSFNLSIDLERFFDCEEVENKEPQAAFRW
jgi:hypothetical protein